MDMSMRRAGNESGGGEVRTTRRRNLLSVVVGTSTTSWAPGIRRRALLAVVGLCASTLMMQDVRAQVEMQPDRPRAMAAPPLSKAVKRAVEATYQSEEDARDLRIFHGVWKASDLNTPQRIATAALVSGAVDDPALSMAEVDPLDRAEAAMLRGDLRETLALLDAGRGAVAEPMRASRLRAETLEMLGRFDEALAVAQEASRTILLQKRAEASDVVEAARALTIAVRITGPATKGSSADYKALVALLDRVRNEQDRMYWPALLAQAELLYEKDNSSEAGDVLKEVLSLNPSCAKAWAMLGQLSVDAFNFDLMEAVAGRLDLLGSGRGGGHDPAEGEEGDGNGGVSIYAGIVRARAMLRQTDPDIAQSVLAPVLERYPKCREALAVACAVQAIRYDKSETDRVLGEFDRLSPGSPRGYFEVGRALSEARQYAMASPYLEEAHRRLPKWAAPVIDLGLMEVQSGRLDSALAALEVAVGLDPFNVRADNSLKLVRELLTYAKIESEHFTIRYKAGVDEVLARDMVPPLEEMYRVVTGEEAGGIDFEPRQKTVIDLMPDHRWFGVRIAGMPAIHTIAASTGPCIAMEAPREGKGHLGAYDWVRVVRHEFTHTVTLDRTNNRIPHWFTEAAAVYLELSPRDYSTCTLLARALDTETLFDMNEINTAFVRPKKPTDRSQAYAQGHWMYQYIVETWGRKAPLDMMDLYASGQREENAFQSVLGVSREEFLKRFKVWAAEMVEAWGLALPEGAPGIKDLLIDELLMDADKGPAAQAALDRQALNASLVGTGAGAAPAVEGEELELPEPTLEMTERWLEKHPTHPDVLELAVRMALQARPKKAATPEMIPLLERYAAARPMDPMPHQLLARLYLTGTVEGAAPDAAIEHLEYLDVREQKTPTYALELAKRYAAKGEWDAAWKKAERATQVSPYEAGSRELAATVAVKRGDFDSAERHLGALVILEPNVSLHKQRLDALKKLREAAGK